MGTHVGPLLAVALGVLGAGCREAPITAPRPITSLPRALGAVNQSYRSLIALLRGLDPGVAFTLANSVWYRPSLTLTPEFVDAAQTYFGARVQSLDFATPTAAPTINGWVSDQTRGKIPAIVPDPVPDDVVAYRTNAIYFKGDWTIRFDPAGTTD